MKYEKEVAIVKYISGVLAGADTIWDKNIPAVGERGNDWMCIGHGTLTAEVMDDTRDAEIDALEAEIKDKSGQFQAWKTAQLEKIQRLRALEHCIRCPECGSTRVEMTWKTPTWKTPINMPEFQQGWCVKCDHLWNESAK